MCAYKFPFFKFHGLVLPVLSYVKTVTSSIWSSVLFVYSRRVSLTLVTFSWSGRKVLSNHFVRENILCLPLFKTLLWIPISITVNGLTSPLRSYTFTHYPSLTNSLPILAPVANIAITLASLLFLKLPRQNSVVLWLNVLSAYNNSTKIPVWFISLLQVLSHPPILCLEIPILLTLLYFFSLCQ